MGGPYRSAPVLSLQDQVSLTRTVADVAETVTEAWSFSGPVHALQLLPAALHARAKVALVARLRTLKDTSPAPEEYRRPLTTQLGLENELAVHPVACGAGGPWADTSTAAVEARRTNWAIMVSTRTEAEGSSQSRRAATETSRSTEVYTGHLSMASWRPRCGECEGRSWGFLELSYRRAGEQRMAI